MLKLPPTTNPRLRATDARWSKSEPERRRHQADNVYFDLQSYIETLLWIRSKQKRLIPFKLNPPQLLHHRRTQAAAEQGRTRHVILKARQMGFTTFELARMFHKCATEDLTAAALVAHEKDTTRRLLEIPKTYYQNLPPQERPPLKYDNREEYYFDGLGSRLIIGTAGALNFGRGLTLHHVHLSEAAFFPDPETLMNGLSESIPMNGWVTIESTPNGVGGYFYDMYMEAKSGQSEYMAHFYPWFLDPEYQIPVLEGLDFEPTHEERNLMEQVARDWTNPVTGEPLTLTHEQLSFRRWKQATLKVKYAESYPEDEITCIASGTRVGTQRGILPIEEVRTGDQLRSGEVVAAEQTGVRDVIRLTTSRGCVLVCTPDHLLANEYHWVRADQSLGCTVRLLRPSLAEAEHVERWTSLGGVQCALTIDERWAEFLGYYMGDGSFYGTGLDLAADGQDVDLIERLSLLCESLFVLDHICNTVVRRAVAE